MPLSGVDLVEEHGGAVLAGTGGVVHRRRVVESGGFPSWGELLDELRDTCRIPEQADLPLVAEYIEADTERGGRDKLLSYILEAISARSDEPTESHRLLAELNIREL